jgi:hypothetical protein
VYLEGSASSRMSGTENCKAVAEINKEIAYYICLCLTHIV